MDLNGKVALVTGGASGIGRETCLHLARNGAKVAVADINEAGAAETMGMIEGDGGKAMTVVFDVTDEDVWPRAIGQVTGKWSGLHVLVNAAGVELMKSMAETSLKEFRWLMSINLDGVFLGTKYGVAAMAGDGGSVINISSVAGINGYPNQTAYCASKGGVRLLTKAAAMEAAQMGGNIRVNSVHPGVIDTPMARAFIADMDEEHARVAWQRLVDLHPIGRMGEASDIANAILFLASDMSSFMTGAELVVDGGMTVR
jgi:3(or 17)beta-hydroxysteroid dehydrogenase